MQTAGKSNVENSRGQVRRQARKTKEGKVCLKREDESERPGARKRAAQFDGKSESLKHTYEMMYKLIK